LKAYKHYLTTPLYYVNSNPHIGHTYTTIVVDIIKKYYELFDEKTYFLTGTDEHGEKILKAAAQNNTDVNEFVDNISNKFKNMWDSLSINYDDFIRTSQVRHKKVVSNILNKLYEKGDIYFASYEGQYCVGCERFLNSSDLTDGLCKDHKTAPKIVAEDNYFFKLKKYSKLLKEKILADENIIRPIKFRNEVLEYLNHDSIEDDLCISRPKTRVSWGVELPFDNKFVTYVWFDALINYISAINYPDDNNFNAMWSLVEHFIAKDILRTHTVYWGTMLLALDLPLYKHLNVHGYWNIEGLKMSKSIGNVVDPQLFKNTYGIENLRYFFLKDMHWGDDADFTIERFISRYNSDLANNFGNLISRTLSMFNKYFFNEEKVLIASNLSSNHSLKLSLDKVIHSYKEDFRVYNFYKTLDLMWFLFDEANKHIASSAPWDLYKNNDIDTLLKVLCPVLEVIRICSSMLYPIMPKTSLAILEELNSISIFKQGFNVFSVWGSLDFVKTKYTNTKFFERILN